jgi:hypothetical protein
MRLNQLDLLNDGNPLRSLHNVTSEVEKIFLIYWLNIRIGLYEIVR